VSTPGSFERRYATLRMEPRPFALRSSDALDAFPRPAPTLVGEVASLKFELDATGPGHPIGVELGLILDPSTYARARSLGAFGLDEADRADGVLALAALASDSRVHILLSADLDPARRRRFSGLDLLRDTDLREAIEGLLADASGNPFHAIEGWTAIAVRAWDGSNRKEGI
jgi:hypothetical protein